ncbi:MAG: glycosyltransferase family 2 protein [Candidatus Micrarchaeales archaeon]|nr:glycosyltransferase family 2 protein [Candidatus Micrarchaeales archaeon]
MTQFENKRQHKDGSGMDGLKAAPNELNRPKAKNLLCGAESANANTALDPTASLLRTDDYLGLDMPAAEKLNIVKLQEMKTNPPSPRFGVVIIGKNEGETVPEVLRKLISAENSIPGNFFNVFVDDGSTDSTMAKAMEFNVSVISNKKSLGIGGAIKKGYEFLKSFNPDYIIQLDSDGEHPAEYLRDLIAPLENNESDIVIGSRYCGGRNPVTSPLKIAGAKLLTLGFAFINPRYGLKDVASGFRAFKSEYLNKVLFLSNRNWAVEFLVRAIKSNLRIKEIPVPYHFREHGVSQFNSPWHYVRYFLNIFKQFVNSVD